ncbi:hypothetical protein BDD12DRAFT_824003 [Trichophaea hybrida]|nr:hypothetical protein BDD12DRAFT_824003 [Trichophaea hybrida]
MESSSLSTYCSSGGNELHSSPVAMVGCTYLFFFFSAGSVNGWEYRCFLFHSFRPFCISTGGPVGFFFCHFITAGMHMTERRKYEMKDGYMFF